VVVATAWRRAVAMAGRRRVGGVRIGLFGISYGHRVAPG
jgi:hypothetical protein